MEQLDALKVEPQKNEDKIVLNESNIRNYIQETDQLAIQSRWERQINSLKDKLTTDLRQMEYQFKIDQENPSNDAIDWLVQSIKQATEEMKDIAIVMDGQIAGYNPRKWWEPRFKELAKQIKDAKTNLEIEEDFAKQDIQANYEKAVAAAKEKTQETIAKVQEKMEKDLQSGSFPESEIQILLTNFQKSVNELNWQIAGLATVKWRDEGTIELKKDSEEFAAINDVAESIESDINNAIGKFVLKEKKADEIMLAGIPEWEIKDMLMAHTEAGLKAKSDTMAASYQKKILLIIGY